jgi:hypothetical protein
MPLSGRPYIYITSQWHIRQPQPPLQQLAAISWCRSQADAILNSGRLLQIRHQGATSVPQLF